MKSIKKYCKDLGFIRLLACIAILMYHMGFLKGGYLSVCTFFVLSGYLTTISCFKNEKLNLGKFYLNKLVKIYIPLVITVFISIMVISFIPSINWFNLKPEATSVLLGYNNFWQLNANLDYFARHIDSPFMHLWYIAIILQFYIIFPVIFKIFKFIGEKVNKILPCIILGLLSIGATIYFYYSSLNGNIMITYYDTFTRMFSLVFGIFLGFIHHYYKTLTFKNKIFNRIIFCLYIVVLMVLNIAIPADSKYFAIVMILVTLMSCRLIDYSVSFEHKELTIFDKIVKSLSDVSYEIYLVQYPIIFIGQYVEISSVLKYVIIVLLTIIISYLINFSLNYKLKKVKVLRYIAFILVSIISIYGGYKYVIAKDYTNEMKELELQLAENEELMKKQQEIYLEKLKQEQEEWNNKLLDLENYEKELPNLVSNLPVVGVGDSVMLGVVELLHSKFPNGYFDAAKSRTAWVANDILVNLSVLGMLGDPVIINLGANGDCDATCKNTIMNTIGSRKVFWVNTPNYNSVNNSLNALASRYNNLYIIDWYSISRGHPEYFIADGVHLTPTGAQVYVDMIYNTIYNVYLNEYNQKKEEILNSYNEEQNKKVTFFGNDLLLNLSTYLNDDFSDAEYVIDEDMSYNSLVEEINKRNKNNSLTSKIYFALDKSVNLSDAEYSNLVNLCNEKKIYIIKLDKELKISSNDNLNIIDFSLELENNLNYLMPDKIHLTEKGNKALKDKITENLNN